MKFQINKGFTLIELLVVIGIIGLLSVLFLPNFMAARERARDTQRKSDLKQFQKVFELYKQDQLPPAFPTPGANNTIPVAAGSCWSSGLNCTGNIYMNKVPTDPSPNKQYYLTTDNNTLTYTLCACLENNADPDGSSTCNVCGTCDSGKCYLVTQP